MKRNIIISVLLLIVAVILLGQGTFAYFSDSASTPDQTFSAGSLQLGDPMAISSWSADITRMLPGDTRTATVEIANTGTLPLQFEARVVATGALFSGDTPATAALDCGSTPTVLAEGATQTCNVTVVFPAGAGNEYNGAGGTLKVEAEAHQIGSTDPWWGVPNPVNGKIAFVSNRDGNNEIYVMNADGSGQTNLTNNAASDNSPSWSPDGSKIAFSSDRPAPAGFVAPDIYVMNADGSGQTLLSNAPGLDFSPSWSPDGGRIAFTSSRDGNNEIYVMNANGSGQATALTNNTVDDTEPSWSPDGSMIAFVSAIGGMHEIYVMNADGSGRTCLTLEWLLGTWVAVSNNTSPAWSPDGSKIAFSSDRDGGILFSQIYVMNTDGSGQTCLTYEGGIAASWNMNPTWSPDGAKIAFESNRVHDGGDQIYIMNADGSVPINLSNNAAIDQSPSWQHLP